MTNSVAVLGSLNVDTTLSVRRLPQPGETVAVYRKMQTAGGKGANQAVAAARSQAPTIFIGEVGQDGAGQKLLKTLKDDDIDISRVGEDAIVPTGAATVLLDPEGQNEITVFGGANQEMVSAELNLAGLEAQDVLITQFETPQEVALTAFKRAKQAGVLTILNPAPAQAILPELLPLTDLIIPNEIESAWLTGIEITDLNAMRASAAKFKEMGIANTIITVGSRGAFFAVADQTGFMSAFKVAVRDETGAGDTFIGALAAQLNRDFSNITAAVRYAQRASSITVQHYGTLAAIPTREEIINAGIGA